MNEGRKEGRKEDGLDTSLREHHAIRTLKLAWATHSRRGGGGEEGRREGGKEGRREREEKEKR